MKSRKKSIWNLVSFFVFACLTSLDQISKYIIETHYEMNTRNEFIKGFVDIFYCHNTGAAWSILEGKMWLFYMITVILMAVIIYVFVKLPASKKYLPLRICLVFLSAGAIGNFIDRVRLQYVRDFILFAFKFPIIGEFPVFNVADIFVTLSVLALLIILIFVYKEKDYEFLKRDAGAAEENDAEADVDTEAENEGN